MCFQATSFNQKINLWNLSSVTTMIYMFCGATSFNQPLYEWGHYISNIDDDNLQYIFEETNYNHDLTSWQKSNSIFNNN